MEFMICKFFIYFFQKKQQITVVIKIQLRQYHKEKESNSHQMVNTHTKLQKKRLQAYSIILNQNLLIQSLNILSKMSYFFYYPLNNCFSYSPQQYNFLNPIYGTESSFYSQLSQTQFFQQQTSIISQNEAQILQNQIQRSNNSQPVHPEQIIKKQQKTKKRRGIDKEKQLQSAKKNSQSNIINQFFSFFSSRMQSDDIVQRAVTLSVLHIEDLQKIMSIFYNVIKCMSIQRVKKYVNKKTLLNVFEKENIQRQIPQILQKFQKLSFVSIDEICEIIRRCCLYFLRSVSLISILSSKRISAVSKYEHLKKRRHITNVISGKI